MRVPPEAHPGGPHPFRWLQRAVRVLGPFDGEVVHQGEGRLLDADPGAAGKGGEMTEAAVITAALTIVSLVLVIVWEVWK